LFNITRRRHIHRAPIRGQCQRDYLYGKDPGLEGLLSRLEGRAADSIRRSISKRAIAEQDVPAIVSFVATLWGRTPVAGALADANATHLVQSIARSHPSIAPEDFAAVSEMRARHESPVQFSLSVSSSLGHVLLDLSFVLLNNESSIEFIASDAPIVFHNQWCEGITEMGVTGFASRGLQCVLPFGKRHALLAYDSDVYARTNGRPGEQAVTRNEDVDQINGLQLLVAHENLYYSGDPATGDSIDRLSFGRHRPPHERVGVHRAVSADNPRSALIHLYPRPHPVRLDLSFLKVRKAWRSTALTDRSQQYRDRALALDSAVRGEPERPALPSANGPWHIVDERTGQPRRRS